MFPFLKNVLGITKKIALVISVYIIVIGLFGYFINRDKAPLARRADPLEKSRTEVYKVINDKKLNSKPEGKIIIALYRLSLCNMVGEACTDNPKDADKNFDKSLFGMMSKFISVPFMNPPASGVYWAYDGLQKAGFLPKTYAAEGVGFAAIKPYANLWKIFRDLSYMILVIILIAIGFMIMFRMKMNPQTVISVENALPKIIVSLILITFSFAIAGFLIDLMYVIIAIAISALSGNNTYYDAGKVTNEFINSGMGKLSSALLADPEPLTVGSAMLQLLGTEITAGIRIISGALSFWLFPKGLELVVNGLAKIPILDQIQIVGTSISGLLQGTLSPLITLAGPVIGVILGIFIFPQLIIGTLIWFTLVLLFFRLFFYLFNTYLKIILLIIFAPFILLFEAVPGKGTFSFWFKSLLANLLSFPIIISLIMVGNIIQSQAASGVNGWRPPFLAEIDPNVYSILVGMAVILMIPDLMKVAREAMGVKDLPVSFGIGTFFGGAQAAGGGIMAGVGQFGSLSLGLTAIAPLLGFQGQNLGAIIKEAGGRLRKTASPSASGKADQEVTPPSNT